MLQTLRDTVKLFTNFSVTPADFIVWGEPPDNPSALLVKNGKTGEIKTYLTATEAIQPAINASGEVKLSEGTFSLGAKLVNNPAGKALLRGAGVSTKLVPTGAFDAVDVATLPVQEDRKSVV